MIANNLKGIKNGCHTGNIKMAFPFTLSLKIFNYVVNNNDNNNHFQCFE